MRSTAQAPVSEPVAANTAGQPSSPTGTSRPSTVPSLSHVHVSVVSSIMLGIPSNTANPNDFLFLQIFLVQAAQSQLQRVQLRKVRPNPRAVASFEQRLSRFLCLGRVFFPPA